MRFTTKSISLCLLLIFSPLVYSQNNIESLLETIEQQSQSESKNIQNRESRFVNQNLSLKQQLSQIENDIKKAERQEKSLRKTIEKNDSDIAKLDSRIAQQAGSLGELAGVIHQAVGDAQVEFKQSLVTAQFPERLETAGALLAIDGIPAYKELEDIWFLLLQDIVESGKVGEFDAQVNLADGEVATHRITRVGSLVAVREGNFVDTARDGQVLVEFSQQPESSIVDIARAFESTQSGQIGSMVIDPTRGEILSMLSQRPGLYERFKQGNIVAVIIALIAAAGLLLAIERMVVLSRVEGAMHAQKGNDDISDQNPLGRILAIVKHQATSDVELLERRIDEEIYKETSGLEKRISLIKMFAVIAPMLGLLGTVTGMIETFQSITLFGTGDPKLMAGGISQALVTTALGLIAAIPLLFLHNIVRTKSNSCVNILEEQSAGLLVKHLERGAA